MSIVSKIKDTFTKKLEEFSKEFNVPYREVQVLIYNKDKVELSLYISGVFQRPLDMQTDILGIKIDFMGKAIQVKMMLDLILGGYASELSCDKSEVQVQLVAQSNEDSSVCLALNKNNQFIRWIDLDNELDL
jgi:hypothetical protein